MGAPARDAKTRPLSPEEREKIAFWLNAAAESIGQMEEELQRAYASRSLMEAQARCDPGVDPDAVIAGMEEFRLDPPIPAASGQWYARLAHALGENGHDAAYRRCLGLAEAEASKCEEAEDAYNVRNKSVMAVADVEGVDGAKRVIAEMKSPRWRAEHYCDVVNNARKPPTTRESRDFVSLAQADFTLAVGDPDEQRLRGNIAMAMVSAGMLAEARQALDDITDESWRASCAASLAVERLRRGEKDAYDAAMKLFNKAVEQPGVPVDRYAGLAVRLRQVSPDSEWKALLQRLDELAASFPSEEASDIAYAVLARGQAKCGLMNEALQTLKKIKSPFEAKWLRASLILTQAEAGDFAAAEEMFAALNDVAAQRGTVEDLFRIEAAAGRDEHLRGLFKKITDPEERARASTGAVVGLVAPNGKTDPRQLERR